jgi:hypothetical protein
MSFVDESGGMEEVASKMLEEKAWTEYFVRHSVYLAQYQKPTILSERTFRPSISGHVPM